MAAKARRASNYPAMRVGIRLNKPNVTDAIMSQYPSVLYRHIRLTSWEEDHRDTSLLEFLPDLSLFHAEEGASKYALDDCNRFSSKNPHHEDNKPENFRGRLSLLSAHQL